MKPNKAAKDAAGMLAGLHAGKAQAATDRKLSGAADAGRAVALLTPNAITPRADDTRPARAEHVLALAESVAAVGLLQPPAVDKGHCLIAGLNRLEACRLLLAAPADRAAVLDALAGAERMDTREKKHRLAALPERDQLPEPLRSGKVPVRVLVELDATDDPDAALAAEVAENTARKQYAPAEIAALVERLRRAGYRETTGRPRKGEKALRPAIGLVLGVSPETARRMLGTRKDGQMTTFPHEDPLAATAARLLRALAAFRKAAAAVPEKQKSEDTRRAVDLAAQLSTLL